MKKLERSTNYRSKYFQNNKGILGTGIYICPYCGKLMKNKSKIAVDHIHSISAIQKSKFWKKYYQHKQDGVNDLSNLTSSCKKCNAKKYNKVGLWLLRGKIGKYFMPILRLLFYPIIIMFTIFHFIYENIVKRYGVQVLLLLMIAVGMIYYVGQFIHINIKVEIEKKQPVSERAVSSLFIFIFSFYKYLHYVDPFYKMGLSYDLENRKQCGIGT